MLLLSGCIPQFFRPKICGKKLLLLKNGLTRKREILTTVMDGNKFDPSALEEDLGDDPIKAGTYVNEKIIRIV